jgi:ribosomal protein S27AE
VVAVAAPRIDVSRPTANTSEEAVEGAAMKKMFCSRCGDEFELLPGKSGFANVCPRCSEQSPEERDRWLRNSASTSRTRRLSEAVRETANVSARMKSNSTD